MSMPLSQLSTTGSWTWKVVPSEVSMSGHGVAPGAPALGATAPGCVAVLCALAAGAAGGALA